METQKPRVSVIMNCRNSAKYLRQAIDSVYAQTYTDWEVVFWDNLSTDGSGDIAKSYDQKLKYFLGDRPLTLGAARNEATRMCRGEFIALLDCDDYWRPDKLAKQVKVMEASSEIGLVYCDCFIRNELKGTSTLFSQSVPPVEHDGYIAMLTGRNFIPCLTVLMRASAVSAAGGFDPGLNHCEEYALFLRILRKHQLAYLNEPLATFRLHDCNGTGLGSLATTAEAIGVIQAEARNLRCPSLVTMLAIQKRLLALRAKLAMQYLKLRRNHAASAIRQ